MLTACFLIGDFDKTVRIFDHKLVTQLGRNNLVLDKLVEKNLQLNFGVTLIDILPAVTVGVGELFVEIVVEIGKVDGQGSGIRFQGSVASSNCSRCSKCLS